MTTPSVELRSAFGEIDIYLFDQLARGHFDRRRRVLDAGCGDGRNLVFFLKNGFTCFGIDRDQAAVAQVRALATRLAPATPPAHFVTGELDELPGRMAAWTQSSPARCCTSCATSLISRASSRSSGESWPPGGCYSLGWPRRSGWRLFSALSPGTRVRLPDGSDRFVVDLAMLVDWTERLGGHLIDPIKTTNVQGQRCMTTWCIGKPA